MNNSLLYKLSTSAEDYLKTIYKLSEQGDRVSTNQIAEDLDVSPASVTSMIKKISTMHPPLIIYKKYYGVILTPEGKHAALQIIRRHRLLEKYLYEVMGFSWDQVHEEAHTLEHFISLNFEEQMARALKSTEYDPHGAPIPNKDLKVPSQSNLKLCKLQKGQSAIIKQVPDENSEFLRYLEKNGVIPGKEFKVIETSPFDKSLKIQSKESETSLVLGLETSQSIFIELVSEGDK